MKRFVAVVVAWLLGGTWAHAQALAAGVALNFCGVNVPVPPGCRAASPFELGCDKYELKWAYLNYAQMGPVAEEVARTEAKKYKQVEQIPLDGFLLDAPAKGYRLSYLAAAGMAYQLIFYGVAKGQPVLVQLTMDVDPTSTADLPEPAQRILRLAR